jgi:hypothetical protein
MRGFGLSALTATEITPAAVRLYARSVEIEIEVEDNDRRRRPYDDRGAVAWSDRL